MGNIIRHQTFKEMLESGKAISGNGPALYYEEGEKKVCLTFQDLLDRIDAVRLPDASCIGVFCDPNADAIINVIAAASAEKQVVMLEPSLPEQALQALIHITDCDGLLGSEADNPALKGALANGIDGPSHNILYFTSGTTSANKAVVLTESSFCSSAYNGSSCDPLAPGDILLSLLPISHVYGFVCGYLWAWECGAAVAVSRGRRHFLDDAAFFQPTAMTLVPALVGFFYQNKLFNPELKQLLIGAGSCSPQLMKAVGDQGISISFGYGLTETSSGVAISTGNPEPTQLSLCPDFQETRLAEDGEILIKQNPCMMQGYYKNPDATAAAIQDGWLHTGDLGKFDDQGKLHIIGRKKEILVLSSGTKIYLPEYEEQLSKALNVEDLCVMLDSSDRVTAILVTDKKPEEFSEPLKAFNATKDRSEQIRYVQTRTEALPRSPLGKLKRWMIVSN
ncbi:MAG: AMP-binding protein [Oscillospiraceae bacterium]|nr:AMP-binding protein [Oscillospiraceae bacterium]